MVAGFGIGEYGMLIPGLDNDNWGVGWSGTHISSDLRDFPVGLRSFEHTGEFFYNFQLMPAAHLARREGFEPPTLRFEAWSKKRK
jgi:hypothetical protein